MELWVRNMWKHGLYKVDGVVAREVNGKWEITGLRSVLPLGEYATKERCLEIIDEIQKLLYSNFIIIRNCAVDEDISEYLKPTKAIAYQAENKSPSIEYHEQGVVVYEMPKE